jgi:hypothetical protein
LLALSLVLLPLVACSFARTFDGFDVGHGAGDAAAEGDRAPDDASVADGPTPADGPAAESQTPLTYRELVLQDRPVGYFPLDEADGITTITDVVGGPSATALNKVKMGSPGAHGTCAEFPGTSDDYINAGDRFDFARQTFSFEFWVKPTIYEQPYYNPITKRAFPNGYSTYFTHSGDGLHASFTWDMGNADASALVYADFPKVTRIALPDGSTPYFDSGFDGNWVHVACTYDKGTMTLYYDGAPAAVQPNGIAPTNTTEALRIGYVFLGQVDEVAFYDYPLGSDRVAAHAHFKE